MRVVKQSGNPLAPAHVVFSPSGEGVLIDAVLSEVFAVSCEAWLPERLAAVMIYDDEPEVQVEPLG